MVERARSMRMRVNVAGVPLDLLDREELMRAVRFRLARRPGNPIVVTSVNLDHVRHFGSFNRAEPQEPTEAESGLRWLHVADGWPAQSRAQRLAGQEWPLLAGSDLLPSVLELAESMAAKVGFLGGTLHSHDLLRTELQRRYPNLLVAGLWSPERSVVDDPGSSALLARDIALSGVDILVVALGKPRQELWLARHGRHTGAVVFLPFGAAADFLAGTATRAPAVLRRLRLEWMWRLLQEPRRMARRYLLEGPQALLALRHASVTSLTPAGGAAPPQLADGPVVPQQESPSDVPAAVDLPAPAAPLACDVAHES